MSAWSDPVTITELLADLDRLGADPATTTIRVDGQPIEAAGYEVVREQGAAIIDAWPSVDPLDAVEEALKDNEQYTEWCKQADVRPVSRATRERLADYLRAALGEG